MAAAAVKGIIISVSIITALGVAAYQDPEVQRWVEEQRCKLVELLRNLSAELDPHARREAEAFAFEGRTIRNDESIRREMEASRDAAAVATGRSNGSPSTVRRIHISGPGDETAAEDRKRKGREYLAQRNQQMYEMQKRKKIDDLIATPSTPTHFDALVDAEGKLKEKELPSPPTHEPGSERPVIEMKEARRNLVEPLLAEEASMPSASSSGWNLGSRLANPFGDEFEMERSVTPRPPVPPKIELAKPATHEPEARHEDLSYEEQMAIALSLSEAESSKPSATVRQNPQDHDADLSAAIAASLRDMDHHQAAHAIANAGPDTPRLSAMQQYQRQQPLVDLTPNPSTSAPQERPRSNWESLFDQANWHEEGPATDPPISLPPQVVEDDEEDLYTATPQLTRARLATFEASQPTRFFDPVRAAASQQEQAAPEASFYSVQSSAAPPIPQQFQVSPQLVDVSEPQEEVRQPSRASSFTFHTESDSETFASLSAHTSRAPSVSRSEISHPAPATPASGRSDIEVVDLEDDSDVDLLSEEGDGIRTPDSWTEVGSRDGESEGEAIHV